MSLSIRGIGRKIKTTVCQGFLGKPNLLRSLSMSADSVSLSPKAKITGEIITQTITIDNISSFLTPNSNTLDVEAARFHLDKLMNKRPDISFEIEEDFTVPAHIFAAFCDELSRIDLPKPEKDEDFLVVIKHNTNKRGIKNNVSIVFNIVIKKENYQHAQNIYYSHEMKRNEMYCYLRDNALTFPRLDRKMETVELTGAGPILNLLLIPLRHLTMDRINTYIRTRLKCSDLLRIIYFPFYYFFVRLINYTKNPYHLLWGVLGRIKDPHKELDSNWKVFLDITNKSLDKKIGFESFMEITRKNRLILFGEMHSEGPHYPFFKRLISRIPDLTHITIEADSGLQAIIDEYSQNKTEENHSKFMAAFGRSFTSPIWKYGRKAKGSLSPRNEAFFDMIIYAIDSGKKVVAIDMPKHLKNMSTNQNVSENYYASGDRDKKHFAPIINKLLANPKNKILGFMGSGHAILSTGEYSIPNVTRYLRIKPFSILLNEDPTFNMLAEQELSNEKEWIIPVPDDLFEKEGIPRLADAIVYSLPASDQDWRPKK
ncbi:MAG: hypothetical protein HQ564_04160 [Candidatus Saganbacteria bacterium]|nr:hypothetical protein [Candidatus Saganbacteria bacterium]